MSAAVANLTVEEIKKAALPLSGPSGNFDRVMNLVGASRYVLLGEASHGTHEFYRARIEITKRLIREKGFTVVAWEADWPDALRVNRFVRDGTPEKAAAALAGFQRFPSWMWRNTDVLDFIGWLASYNSQLPEKAPKAGIYGLDLYSLHKSMDAVVAYLEKVDPQAARAAQRRYSCFEDFGSDPQDYGHLASQLKGLSCEEEVVQQLTEILRHEADFLREDGTIAADELFFAEQNARVAVNAEEYYRALYHGRQNTWNLRDIHMRDTLDNLVAHLERQGQSPKVVLWAHNSHLGDARATEMSARGELNVGQLIKQQRGRDAVLVGFTTYSGTVTAADDWDATAQRKVVQPALKGSYEQLFHDTQVPNFYLKLRDNQTLANDFENKFIERAIGVIYRPKTERSSHYFKANLAHQFDAVIHFDSTRAVEPLDANPEWEAGELPETFPSGM